MVLKIILLVCLLILLSFPIFANELKPFKSDGCSLFPDKVLMTQVDWCDCCFQHDVVYWRGGTKAERKKADKDLKKCVLVKTESNILAAVMYRGVRFGGVPYFYNWYYWGYGWQERRGYQPLSAQERKMADTLLQEYSRAQKNAACHTG